MQAASAGGLVCEPIFEASPTEGVHTIEERQRLEQYLHTYLRRVSIRRLLMNAVGPRR